MLGLLSLREEGKFRHNVPFVPVSGIAEQYYCELKVDYSYTQGAITTEDESEGTAIHEELLAMQKTTLDEIIEKIQKRPLYTASFPVGARVGDIIVVGLPDAIIFENGKPTFVLELKTTRSDPNILWHNQEIQAKTYALLLDLMGFDCSQLKIAIVKTSRRESINGVLKVFFLRLLTQSLVKGETETFEKRYKGTVKVFRLSYSKSDAIKSIEWAQDYWLSKRNPIPTNHIGKCRVCEFNGTCRPNAGVNV